MQTNHVSQKQMESRVARFRALQPLAIQQGNAVPQAARDVVYARKLLSVIGLDGERLQRAETRHARLHVLL